MCAGLRRRRHLLLQKRESRRRRRRRRVSVRPDRRLREIFRKESEKKTNTRNRAVPGGVPEERGVRLAVRERVGRRVRAQPPERVRRDRASRRRAMGFRRRRRRRRRRSRRPRRRSGRYRLCLVPSNAPRSDRRADARARGADVRFLRVVRDAPRASESGNSAVRGRRRRPGLEEGSDGGTDARRGV